MDETMNTMTENKTSENRTAEHSRPTHIRVRGAKVHNLKNVNVDIPLNQIVGIAGVSGSGKSSLALGILYAALYIGIMLAVDLLYGVLDPRIRVAAKGKEA